MTHEYSIAKARKRWIEDLEALCPTLHRVKVVWSDPGSSGMEDCIGYCVLVEGKSPYFLIRVNKTLNRSAQCVMLAHEWAHAMSWWQVKKGFDHGKAWGIAHSKTYQAAVAL